MRKRQNFHLICEVTLQSQVQIRKDFTPKSSNLDDERFKEPNVLSLNITKCETIGRMYLVV
jgi:hypothetical protein